VLYLWAESLREPFFQGDGLLPWLIDRVCKIKTAVASGLGIHTDKRHAHFSIRVDSFSEIACE
jgi:hypothetical protein